MTSFAESRGVTYIHAKQSGGVAQYAEIVYDVERLRPGAGYQFVDASLSRWGSDVDRGCLEELRDRSDASLGIRIVLRSAVDRPESNPSAFFEAGRMIVREAFRRGYD